MAYKGKRISNPVTGQDLLFLQTATDTAGRLLEIESTYHAASKEPVAHYHPNQDEDFTVLQGVLTVRLNGTLRELKAGDALHIPKTAVHSMWNASAEKTVVNWKVRPALDTEHLLETGTGLAADGKLLQNGQPPLLQVALLAQRFSPVFRLAKPPILLQKILFALLAPVARLRGYHAVYQKYLD